MGGGEGVNLGSWGAAPSRIRKSIPQDGLLRPVYVTPEGVDFFPVCNPRGRKPIFSTVGIINVQLPPRLSRGQEVGGD